MVTRSTSDSWIVYSKTNVRPRLRLFCFPYAGGNASAFQSWADLLPDEVQVCAIQLPGRQRRMMEPPYTRLLPLLDALSEALGPYLDVPYAIFGNCTGSFISFELSHTLTRSSGRSPVHLFTSNCRAPQLPETDAPIHALPDAALLDELQRLGGTPVEIIQHPELMGLVLPTLRADFELAETYEYSPKEPLDCPITTFGGLQDCIVTQDLLRPWGEQTRGSFKLQMLPGSHYMLESAQEFLVSAISSDLAPHLAR